MIANQFSKRHIGPRDEDVKYMLEQMGLESLDQLIDGTIPKNIRLENPLKLEEGLSEYEYLQHIKDLGSKNKVFKSYIGLGYYETIVPSVIQRNVLENPGWYTSYTPYQAEISQGRLEALLNFQTLVSELTAMPLANASLLDEGTAAAEAMLMFFHSRSRKLVKANVNTFLVSENMFPQTIEVLKVRAESRGIELKVMSPDAFEFDGTVFGCMIQYPDQNGHIVDHRARIASAKEQNIPVAVASDLLSLTLLTPPGEWGADVVFGTTQRFGVPMGYGGPHAAYFATTEDYKRHIPGRIIGISKDVNGHDALRMALQTREQHIKRERATSNICTAQALLAIMAGFYGVYHGRDGLTEIARDIHSLAADLADGIENTGFSQLNANFFDTLKIEVSPTDLEAIRKEALKRRLNFRYFDTQKHIGISLNETTSQEDIIEIIEVFASVSGKEVSTEFSSAEENSRRFLPEALLRQTSFLDHAVFEAYRSETDMMRYLKMLENKDIALNRSMIPLGSCTMKLNAASELFPISWPEFANLHPFAPVGQAEGYLEMIREMEKDLCEVTGFAGISFQPNSGAAGEYTGLMVIREFQRSLGESQRNICLIPASAHGTNPASAIMAGMEVVVVKTSEQGDIDLQDLKEKAEKHKDHLAAIMVTYPSTHGVFEEGIGEVIRIVHDNGGQVYMDGANMNAQVGLTSPGFIGADVCHLNLHKTFGIPHGGGGPGIGPIGVASHLVDFLPGHIFAETGGSRGIPAISAAPFGSALALIISYGYLKMLGAHGLTEATRIAILNANYLLYRLKDHYPILYTGKTGKVGHEMILDCNQFSKSADITVVDIAKRLMDYGFHAPTVAFPVQGTLMVEPTESESLNELNFFAEALISIRQEIKEIEEGKAEKQNNVVANAPHTAEMVITDDFDKPYSRQKAAYPLEWVKSNKYFTPVGKIDDAYGDRNLCTCIPVEAFDEPVIEVDIKEV
jgi:glycine dehydrogenase